MENMKLPDDKMIINYARYNQLMKQVETQEKEISEQKKLIAENSIYVVRITRHYSAYGNSDREESVQYQYPDKMQLEADLVTSYDHLKKENNKSLDILCTKARKTHELCTKIINRNWWQRLFNIYRKELKKQIKEFFDD